MRSLLLPLLFVLVSLICFAGCTAPGHSGSNGTAPGPDGYPVVQSPVKTVRVDDIDIAYRESGQGDPLILITGYGSTMDLWPPGVIANLSVKNRVIVFDNRGMGCSTASEKQFSVPLFADDTAGLMDSLNISRASVLGWSMGADVAQELVLRHPEKVDRLILYAGSSGGNESIQPSPQVIAALTNTTGTPREQGGRLFGILFPAEWLRQHPDSRTYFPIPTETSDPESYSRQSMAISLWNGTYSRLHDIRSPTLVLTGTQDVISVPGNAFILAGQIPGAWVIQVNGGGHGMMYQYPEQFEQIVNFFLDQD